MARGVDAATRQKRTSPASVNAGRSCKTFPKAGVRSYLDQLQPGSLKLAMRVCQGLVSAGVPETA
jgi:hypothetical protein